MTSLTDTICAIATPLGVGGIGIVRLSGSQSRNIVSQICTLKQYKSHTICYAKIIDPFSDTVVDDVLVSYFETPCSYTGEDTVEINCHGGYIVLQRVMSLLLSHGARHAEPGEFTKRAFLNGKIDLAQAEAVVDLIHAKSEKSAAVAIQHLEGALSKKIMLLRQQLVDLVSHIEVHLDYPDEEDLHPTEDYSQTIETIRNIIDHLIGTFSQGKLLRIGIRTVIVGLTNVGKSSLLNAILQEERAIVSSFPGTTRDTIEDYLILESIPFQIMDTAGIRHTQDPIEALGITRTLNKLAEAELVLCVVDQSCPMTAEEQNFILTLNPSHTLIIKNKIDLPDKIGEIFPLFKTVALSAKTHEGMDQLKKSMVLMALSSVDMTTDEVIITTLRQQEALLRSRDALQKTNESILKKYPEDFWLIDLKDAIIALGSLTGDEVTDEILDNIFAQFCVGK